MFNFNTFSIVVINLMISTAQLLMLLNCSEVK